MDKSESRLIIMGFLLSGGFDETVWEGEFGAEIAMIDAIRRYENVIPRMEQEDKKDGK